jgi:anaphase-promoting complex subunit 1
MVLAGTGDLDTFRLLKVLRWPCTDDITYGSHLAYATAIGLLFLGGGTCTLGRDPKDIASLVVSFYPRYPQSTSDNQYHLQALRNLYALASKTREIRAIDVDTGESVFVPVEVHFENKSKMPTRLSTPCVLLNTEEKIKELRVVARNYFPLTIAFNGKSEGKLFFVKRKSAYLCHENDRNSEMTLVARTIDFRTRVNLECVCMLTGDKRVLQFAEHLCSICDSKKKWNLSAKWSLTQFCVRVLHEAFLLDTQDVIPLYLALWNSISFIMAGTSALSVPWDFRLIAAFFQQQPAGCVWSKTISRLLNPEVFAYLVQRMEVVLESLSMQEFRESDEMDLS